MKKRVKIWLSLFVILGLYCGCNQGKSNTSEEILYTNDEWGISFVYSDHWVIKHEDYQTVILSPVTEVKWQPQKPESIAKEPFVTISLGAVGIPPTYSSTSVDENTLRQWLTQHSLDGPDREFSERVINNQVAFEITEVSVPGCDRIIYWRPTNIESIVRLTTGCENPYMEDFEQIVESIQELDSK